VSGLRRFATDDHRKASVSYWRDATQALEIPSAVRRIIGGLIVTIGIVMAAVAGYMLNGWSWNDALYMVVITIFGVGYGETRPVDTLVERWLTIGLILCGYLAIIYTVGGFAQLLIDGELRRLLGLRRMQRDIEQLRNHVVICGFGRMGTKLAEELATRGRALIVVDENAQCVETARAYGCLAIQGNATEETTLRAAGVERASILTTVLSDDVANLFITITARDLNPDLQILARAEQTSTIKKLRQVGATHVILPAIIGADRLANMILRPSAESLLRRAELPSGMNEDLSSLGLRLDELEIQQGSSLIGDTVSTLLARSRNTFLIVALREASGNVILNPRPHQPLALGDCVVVLGHIDDISELCAQYRLQSELEPEANEAEEELSKVAEK
jgi:voltage-gated potassium channel